MKTKKFKFPLNVQWLFHSKWGLMTLLLLLVIMNQRLTFFANPGDRTSLYMQGVVISIETNILPMMKQLQEANFVSLEPSVADMYIAKPGTNMLLAPLVTALVTIIKFLKKKFPGKTESLLP